MLTPTAIYGELEKGRRQPQKSADGSALLQKHIAAARKRLADEQARFVRLQGHLGQSEADTPERVVDPVSFAKHKQTLSRIRTDLDVTADAIETLKTTINRLQSELNEANKAKHHACHTECHRVMAEVVEPAMTELLGQLVQMRDDYLACCTIFCGSFGCSFNVPSSECVPTPMHDRIDRHLRRLIKPVDLQQRMAYTERLKKKLPAAT
jgi:hypothetical protein